MDTEHTSQNVLPIGVYKKKRLKFDDPGIFCASRGQEFHPVCISHITNVWQDEMLEAWSPDAHEWELCRMLGADRRQRAKEMMEENPK